MCVAFRDRLPARSFSSLIGLIGIAWLMIGCNSGGLPDMVPVRGEVIYNGAPLNEGNVVYLPAKVTFLEETISPALFANLGARNDGNVGDSYTPP